MVMAFVLAAIIIACSLLNFVLHFSATKPSIAWLSSLFTIQSLPSPPPTKVPHLQCHSLRKVDRRDADLRRVFAIFDHNNDGFITQEELKESMENVGLFLSDEELDSVVRNLDADGDGCLDLEEFCVLYESMTGGGKRGTGDEEIKGVGAVVVGDDELKEAFDVFDVNGDGFISVEELSSVLGSLRLKNGWRECKEMIQKVDLDGDGRVNFQEFQQMMKAGGFTSLC
ncbi:putative calcium-binding protein [Nymphaea thermarum]|nr:putative calcium-binding protein [Nymphaea thermarum]